jgi:hypothetical protein
MRLRPTIGVRWGCISSIVVFANGAAGCTRLDARVEIRRRTLSGSGQTVHSTSLVICAGESLFKHSVVVPYYGRELGVKVK